MQHNLYGHLLQCLHRRLHELHGNLCRIVHKLLRVHRKLYELHRDVHGKLQEQLFRYMQVGL